MAAITSTAPSAFAFSGSREKARSVRWRRGTAIVPGLRPFDLTGPDDETAPGQPFHRPPGFPEQPLPGRVAHQMQLRRHIRRHQLDEQLLLQRRQIVKMLRDHPLRQPHPPPGDFAHQPEIGLFVIQQPAPLQDFVVRLIDPGQFRPFRPPVPPQGGQSFRPDSPPLHHPDPGLHLFQPSLTVDHLLKIGKAAPLRRPEHRLMNDQFLLRRGHAVKGLFGQMMQDKLVKGENPDPAGQPGISLQPPAHLRRHPGRGNEIDHLLLPARQAKGPSHAPREAGGGIQINHSGHILSLLPPVKDGRIFRHTRYRDGTRCNCRQRQAVRPLCTSTARRTRRGTPGPKRRIRKLPSSWNVRSVYTIFSAFCFMTEKPSKAPCQGVEGWTIRRIPTN